MKLGRVVEHPHKDLSTSISVLDNVPVVSDEAANRWVPRIKMSDHYWHVSGAHGNSI